MRAGIKVLDAVALFEERWKAEEVTCADLAPAGDLAAHGTQVSEATRGALNRKYGSRLRLVDARSRRTLNSFDIREVGPKPREDRGGSATPSCRFVHGQRFAPPWPATTGAAGQRTRPTR
jgi:hypothetical protein